MARSSSAVARMAVVVVVVVVMMALTQGSMATTYVVGGPLGWSDGFTKYNYASTFYQDWVQSNFPYCGGDILEFYYPAGESILAVDKAHFDACDMSNPIFFQGVGERFTFQMRGNWQYYFISGTPGHCAAGQKFSIWVDKFC